MTPANLPQSEFRTSIEVEMCHLVKCHDLITSIAEETDLSYRVDEARDMIQVLGRYVGQLVNVEEQDTP